MQDAKQLWLQVRELNLSDPDAAGELIRELEAMPDAASAIETTMSAGTAYGTLRVLKRADAQSLALRVLPLLVYWVGETQMYLDHVREVVRGLPHEELDARLWPIMEHLLRLLAAVVESDNSEVDGVWDTPTWEQPL